MSGVAQIVVFIGLSVFIFAGITLIIEEIKEVFSKKRLTKK
jgi:hypothetical protein